jgi:hypothetical protein
MRDVQKQGLPHPFAPCFYPLGMARGTETSGAAGKHQQPFLSAVRAPDTGKSAPGIAAVQIALNDFLDDGAEKAVLLLETTLILSHKAIEMMEQHPVENRPLRMSRPIHSRHGKDDAPGNGPTS